MICNLLFVGVLCCAVASGDLDRSYPDQAPEAFVPDLNSVPYMRFAIDRETFEDIATVLFLSDAQRLAAERLFEDYWRDLIDLEAQKIGIPEFEQYGKHASRAMLERRQGREPDWDAVDEANRKSSKVQWVRNAKEEEVLESFYSRLGELLAEEQQQVFERVPRLVRRAAFNRLAGRESADFWSMLDLAVLVEQSIAAGEFGEWADPSLLLIDPACSAGDDVRRLTIRLRSSSPTS